MRCLTGQSVLPLAALISKHYSAGAYSNNKTKQKPQNVSISESQNL